MSTTPVASYNLINAFTSCMKRYVKFDGRASRSEYWFWVLANCLIGMGSGFLVGMILAVSGNLDAAESVGNLLDLILTIIFFLPGLGVTFRRLHDTGHSGWNLLWALLPVIGWIILLVFYCTGSSAANQYGEGPAAPEA